jgi:hypothetical protein
MDYLPNIHGANFNLLSKLFTVVVYFFTDYQKD